MDYKDLKLTKGKYWDVFLHEDQTVPGRSYFWYKGNKKDLLDIQKEAVVEFFTSGKKIKSALQKSFKPDRFNYLSLSNCTDHVHIHIIPRYSRSIKLFGVTFQDTAFGKSYKRNKKFKLGKETLIKIKEKIQGAL